MTVWALLLGAPPHASPERMKKIPDTKARMVLWGRICPMLLITNAVKTRKRLTMGNGVAVRMVSAQRKRHKEEKSQISWSSVWPRTYSQNPFECQGTDLKHVQWAYRWGSMQIFRPLPPSNQRQPESLRKQRQQNSRKPNLASLLMTMNWIYKLFQVKNYVTLMANLIYLWCLACPVSGAWDQVTI